MGQHRPTTIISLPAPAVVGVKAATADKVNPVESATLTRHAPTAHIVCGKENDLRARCSIWADASSLPKLDGEPIGVIGHYAAADAEAGVAVLRTAANDLAKRGFRRAVGPMDGNTWRRYRLLTDRGNEPTFFLEPENPDDWPGHFTAAGFVPLAGYFSAINADLSVTDPRVPAARERLAGAGIRVRPIDLSRLDAELAAVHALSLQAFTDNFLYTPVDRDEFIAMYAPLRPHLVPELVLLAEQDAQLMGYLFGLPDLAEAQRGQRITTAIAKTMAVRPGRRSAGLGSILMDDFQQSARRLGFSRVIHALMHESNRSRNISAHFSRPFRRYTLYLQELP